jgi:hypothetical protein
MKPSLRSISVTHTFIKLLLANRDKVMHSIYSVNLIKSLGSVILNSAILTLHERVTGSIFQTWDSVNRICYIRHQAVISSASYTPLLAVQLFITCSFKARSASKVFQLVYIAWKSLILSLRAYF